MPSFTRVSKYSFNLILDIVKFSLLIDLKSRNFVFNSFRKSLFALSKSVTNFILQLMSSGLTEGFLSSYNHLVSSTK